MARALTKKRKSDGSVYTRPSEIDACIDSLLELGTEVVCQRASSIHNKEAGSYIPSECLVHLIRETRRAVDSEGFEKLLSVLLKRCESNLLNRIAETIPGAHEIREDVMSDFAELFALEWEDESENRLDFYEVRFQQAFATLRKNRVTAELRRLQRLRPLLALDSHSTSEDWDAELEELGNAASVDGLAGLDLEGWELINSLPADQKRVFVLCRVLGYQEESIDPEEPTASSLLNVTGRTVRNRLARALSALRGKVEEKT